MADEQTQGNTWTRQITADGAFSRQPTGFRAEIGSGPNALHPAESERYHLYVSLACPWAHRTLIVRALKGLEQVISVDVVHPHLSDKGWSFDTGFHGATGDTVAARQFLREAYLAADPHFNGVVTVPVLWDKRLGTIVNNESAEIIRMFNSGFQDWARHPEVDLYPAQLRTAIDETNAWVYEDINNGVYRSGFARSQQAHEAAVERLFAALDRAEAILMRQNFLCGDVLTEADIRLFVTLIRFDSVYHTHFKCNRKTVLQSQALTRYMADIYRLPGVAATLDLEHIRHHYYGSHKHINPSGLIPNGPDVLAALTDKQGRPATDPPRARRRDAEPHPPQLKKAQATMTGHLRLHGRMTNIAPGLRVRRVLPALERRTVGPFVFFDEFGPATLAPEVDSDVGGHPHIGLATVTYLFEGRQMHRDSIGSVQLIEPGAVNWMTAGRGIVHSERTHDDDRGQSRTTHGLQLWVALPPTLEDCDPAFQHVPAADIPAFDAAPGVQVRVLVGNAWDRISPVRTASETLYLDVTMAANTLFTLPPLAPELAVYGVDQDYALDGEAVAASEMVVLASGQGAQLKAGPEGARLVVIGGAPVEQPVRMWWNFVSAQRERLAQAADDWLQHRFTPIPGETDRIEAPPWRD